ncbi:MAG: CGGC domain-containing protein [Limnochordia bacterium]|nr:CGGC domain-containing protein [Limnochordia bacterium]MDD2629289.1 CGGC domain-containing protein [Limnochordia bacterium]MDD4518613.1 CGGC domain-containing protein [Limnochordia bacterium]
MVKVGIIRCQQTEDMCPGTTDFLIAKEGKCVFEQTGPVVVIGFVSCGGCPGKRAVARAKLMVDSGAEAIVLASCISKGTPIGYPCPHFETMRNAIKRKCDITVLEWTH